MTTNFLKQAITALSPEEFDNVVSVFISEYFGYESVNVNGHGDGGNDIKVYKNKKEKKKCIQLTVRKDYKKKLFEDLPKVEKLIVEYKYSSFFDFYCSSKITETEIDELKKYAEEQYDIALDIYDANRLVQLGQKKFKECILRKYPELQYKADKFHHSRQERILYDVLSLGKDTSDIKNGILYSFIVCAINEDESISFKDLKSKIKVLFPNIDPNDLPRAISYLKQENRIDKTDDNKYKLTDQEKKCIEVIYMSNLKDEQDFYNGLRQILGKYNVSNPDNKIKEIIEKLCDIYKKDIDDKSFDATEAQENFQKYIRSLSKDNMDEIEQQVEQFCAENDYFQRLTYSESFFSLYKSNKLQDYINEKDNVIFFDTPAFVYYLCSKCTYNTDSWEWDNPLYKYICSLLNICSVKQNVHLKIMNNYIDEAAGELKKALQLSWIIDKYPDLANTTQTNNSFLEFYRWAKKQNKFEDGIDTFSDFVVEFLGVNVDEIDKNAFYAEVYRNFKNILNGQFDIVYNSTISDFEEHVIVYEKMLDDRNGKSKGAIRHDVNQMIYLLNRDSHQLDQYSTNLYFVTWDKTLYKLRDILLSKYANKYRYEYFYIIQPSKLVNKFAMANFKINNSQLNSSVLAYADKYFGTSSKIKGLLDYIAPLFHSNTDIEKSAYFLTQILKIEKGQLDIFPEVEKSTNSKTSAQIFADVLEFVLPSSEKETNQKILNDKFKQIIFTKEGTDYLFDFVKTLAQIERKQWQQQKDDFYANITFELPCASVSLN